MRREPGAEAPRDLTFPSNHVAPPLGALKGPQDRKHHTSRNDEEVEHEVPSPPGRLPHPRSSYVRRLGCTNYDCTPAGTSPWPFPKIAFKHRSWTLLDCGWVSHWAGPERPRTVEGCAPLVATSPRGGAREDRVHACLSPLGHLATGGKLAN